MDEVASQVEVSPLQARGELSGFLLSGRWPATTLEWVRVLLLAVRMAAVPGLLPTTTVFRVRDDLPDAPLNGPPDGPLNGPRDRPRDGPLNRPLNRPLNGPRLAAVGMVMAEGTFTGAHPLEPGQFAAPQPAGLFVLHPPSETRPSLPEVRDVASGCVLLPGLPYLGLEHRAGWIEAGRDGTVTSMVSRSGIDPGADADTAVLALLIAA